MNVILKFSLITFGIMMFIGQGYYLGTTFDERVIVEEGSMIVRPYVEPDDPLEEIYKQAVVGYSNVLLFESQSSPRIQYDCSEGYKKNYEINSLFQNQSRWFNCVPNDFIIVPDCTYGINEETGWCDPEQDSKQLMKINIENILELVKNNPDLLTDDEVDILLSIAVGKGNGFTDPEVDAKGEKIMWKIAGQVKKIES